MVTASALAEPAASSNLSASYPIIRPSATLHASNFHYPTSAVPMSSRDVVMTGSTLGLVAVTSVIGVVLTAAYIVSLIRYWRQRKNATQPLARPQSHEGGDQPRDPYTQSATRSDRLSFPDTFDTNHVRYPLPCSSADSAPAHHMHVLRPQIQDVMTYRTSFEAQSEYGQIQYDNGTSGLAGEFPDPGSYPLNMEESGAWTWYDSNEEDESEDASFIRQPFYLQVGGISSWCEGESVGDWERFMSVGFH